MNKRNVGLTPHFHPENIPFAELCQDLRQIRHALRRAPIRTGAFQIPRLHAELPRRVVVVLQRITHHQNRRRLNPQRLAGMAINAFLRFPVAHDERPRTGVRGEGEQLQKWFGVWCRQIGDDGPFLAALFEEFQGGAHFRVEAHRSDFRRNAFFHFHDGLRSAPSLSGEFGRGAIPRHQGLAGVRHAGRPSLYTRFVGISLFADFVERSEGIKQYSLHQIKTFCFRQKRSVALCNGKWL